MKLEQIGLQGMEVLFLLMAYIKISSLKEENLFELDLFQCSDGAYRNLFFAKSKQDIRGRA